MKLVTDAVLVVPGSRNDEKQWLFAGIAGTFRQDVVQLSVRLSVSCIIKVPKVATQKWRKLHLQNGGNCRLAFSLAA